MSKVGVRKPRPPRDGAAVPARPEGCSCSAGRVSPDGATEPVGCRSPAPLPPPRRCRAGTAPAPPRPAPPRSPFTERRGAGGALVCAGREEPVSAGAVLPRRDPGCPCPTGPCVRRDLRAPAGRTVRSSARGRPGLSRLRLRPGGLERPPPGRAGSSAVPGPAPLPEGCAARRGKRLELCVAYASVFPLSLRRFSCAGTARGAAGQNPPRMGLPPSTGGNRSHRWDRVSLREGSLIAPVPKAAVPRSQRLCLGKPGSAQHQERLHGRTSPARSRTQDTPGEFAAWLVVSPGAGEWRRVVLPAGRENGLGKLLHDPQLCRAWESVQDVEWHRVPEVTLSAVGRA
ncbi:collagen alpha-1(I) chain-like [Chiroxiphia lanceolata]|uniref:collagen alpha-1(I) chain-like n=1 Tax=Chiroxiphia lanceolata TaxID=296741 RepID=UPI0013CF0776|nr:collagen alpha-1(I) chain-like [Chiroxiphia lanceolata]